MNVGGTSSSETVYFELIDAFTKRIIPQSLLPVWVNVALGRASERFPIYSAGSTLLRSQLIGMSIEEPADGKQRFVPVNREIVMRFIVLVLVLLLTETSLSFAQGHMGTPQEQQACRRDAQRFCRQQLGNDGAVQQCLQQNRTRLSKSCQKVFASHGM
jgi:hypothetical protein